MASRKGHVMPEHLCRIGITIAVVSGILMTAAPATAQVETFQGTIAQQQGPGGRSGLTRFRIQVSQWSTQAEVEGLLRMLRDDGWERVEDEVLRTERGRFNVTGELGHNVGVARSLPGPDGGRIIRLVSARPLFMFEQRNRTYSRDYPFGVIELHLDAEGKGTGGVYAAAKMFFNDDGQLVIESFGNPPYSILSVESDQ